jgi:hypothetical protein
VIAGTYFDCQFTRISFGILMGDAGRRPGK